MALWPDDFMAYYRLAQLYVEAKEFDQAILYLKECLQLRPDYIDARMLFHQITQGGDQL